jgi:hypothetical protein
MAYGKITGSSIGSLLRMIAEQKSESPIVPPGAEVGSPIRGVVQEPLEAPESPGSQRTANLRPEGVIAPMEQAEPTMPMRSAVGPLSIGGAPIEQTGNFGPAGPLGEGGPAPVPTPGPTPTPQAPGQTRYTAEAGGKQTAPGQSKVSAPAIGTRIGAPTPTSGVQMYGPTQDEMMTANIAQRGRELDERYEKSQRGENEWIAEKERTKSFLDNPNSATASAAFRGNSYVPEVLGASTRGAFGTTPSIPRTSQAPAVNIASAVRSGGLSTAPKLATKIDPLAWLKGIFGRR